MGLVYALELPRIFKKSKAVDQVEFWKCSLVEAFISLSLAKKVLSDPYDWKASFLVELMHDVGILVLDDIIPEEYYKFLTLKDLSSTDQSLYELEKDLFRIDHSEVGVMFMKKWWAISDRLNSFDFTHHEPGSTKSKAVDLDQVVSTA